MSFSWWTRRLLGAIIIAIGLSSPAFAQSECWKELENLPSDTTVSTLMEKVRQCSVEQGVILAEMRSTIDRAEQAVEEAKRARDVAIASAQSLSETTAYVSAIYNPWRQEERTWREIMETVFNEWRQGLPDLERTAIKYEFAIVRNGGLRTITFSEWNGGIRAMTSPYLRGDYVNWSQHDAELYGRTIGPGGEIRQGGSFWLIGTFDSRDQRCIDEFDDRVFHGYLGDLQNAGTPSGGNGCSYEGHAIFRRNNLLIPLSKAEE